MYKPWSKGQASPSMMMTKSTLEKTPGKTVKMTLEQTPEQTPEQTLEQTLEKTPEQTLEENGGNSDPLLRHLPHREWRHHHPLAPILFQMM
jgi:hypothetical protein